MSKKLLLEKILDIANQAKQDIHKLQGDLDFTLDISIEAYGINHPIAIEARDLDWRPARQDETAWYEKSDEYGEISVFVE